MKDYRNEIDRIDKEILSLYTERMQVAEKIGLYKKENHLPVHDPEREREKLVNVSKAVPAEYSDSAVSLYSLIMEQSRARQNQMVVTEKTIADKILDAIEKTPKVFPENAMVACQGVSGAYSQIACDKLFHLADIFYCRTFADVFNAIEKGLCEYGVVPVENSTAGSVNAVYDLMIDHKFSIVKSVRVKVDHCLLVKPGTELKDIKEVYSHGQAIAQCSAFLAGLSGVKVTEVSNTAVAAKMVSESERNDVAAICSETCAEQYNLKCLKHSIQDNGNNFTRFICISKKLEIYPGSDRTSLMMVLPHKQGSLYRIISCFNALGINMNKLESRPMPERNFEFMFYFDLETSVYSESFRQLLLSLDELADEYAFLGSYTEVV